MMEKCIIAAIAENLAIGRNNSLLWHIPEDLRYFKRTTMGCPVIMGRKTYESIGRPLPGRLNIVVSGHGAGYEGVVTAASLEEAYAIAEKDGNASRCFVIGGGQLYAEAMEFSEKLYVTAVHEVFEDADTFFPEIDSGKWRLTTSSGITKDEKSGLEFEFRTYMRVER